MDVPPTNPTVPSPEAPAGARGMQRAIGLLIAALVLLIGMRWYTDRARPRPTELQRDSHRVELNRASRSELMQLPGVGPGRADKILAYRAANGAFQRVDDLRAVNGIGDITLQRLKPHLKVDAAEATEDEPVRLSRKPAKPSAAARASGTKKPTPEEPIDPNRASLAELQRLPGVGPTLAQRIVDARDKQAFTRVEDLRRVSGIGAKRLEQIRPYLVVQQ